MSRVTETAAAACVDVEQHFARRLALETDCSDVRAAMTDGDADFVLVDVRQPALFARSHVAGAINLPHSTLVVSALEKWPGDTLFVVYCAGPHCNGADKAALRLARLGRRVKVMIGGLTGWSDEGYPLATVGS